jgi:hypothetical protein
VNIALTAIAIKKHLELPLSEEEQTLETSYRGKRHARA